MSNDGLHLLSSKRSSEMIESFKHKGLRQLFQNDIAKGVSAEHVRKLRQILGVLHAAETI